MMRLNFGTIALLHRLLRHIDAISVKANFMPDAANCDTKLCTSINSVKMMWQGSQKAFFKCSSLRPGGSDETLRPLAFGRYGQSRAPGKQAVCEAVRAPESSNPHDALRIVRRGSNSANF